MSAEDFKKDLDAASKRLLSEPPRLHLGASQIGGTCAREPWYAFRHAMSVENEGRVMRLWDRGRKEEARIWQWLAAMGITVRPWAERLLYNNCDDSFENRPWDEAFDAELFVDVSLMPHMIETAIMMDVPPKQYGFADHGGHYSGSTDGEVEGLEKWFPEVAGLGPGNLECKTHNLKSFTELDKLAVQQAKREHYVQMQEYMHYRKLRWSLYIGVNKNDDDLYPEIVMYRPEVGQMYSDRARDIIGAIEAPKRISNDPSHYGCRFCDFKPICHFKAQPQKNCRSCAYSQPIDGKQWECKAHRSTIPADFISKGCAKWVPIS